MPITNNITDRVTTPHVIDEQCSANRKHQKMVSHRALHAERIKHKKTRIDFLNLRQQLDELQLAYFNLLVERQKQPHQQTILDAPDPKQNIVAYIRWLAINC